MENKDKTFNYTYSATQREELKRIRQKYIPLGENKMSQLRRLDKESTAKATAVSIILGVLSTLVMGVGMCCTMVWTDYFVAGIIIGLVGIAGIASAYPVYKMLAKKQREKLTPQILALTDELMNEL